MDETPANRVPDNIVSAARRGDADAVRRWLESGGDPNWNLVHPNSHGFPSHYRLLMFTAAHDQRDVMRVLISHGADVQYLYGYIPPDHVPPDRALDVAMHRKKAEAVRLLLDNGADVSRLNSDAWEAALGNHRLLRIVLAAGADFNALCVNGRTPEAFARNRRNAAVTIFDDRKAAIYEETVSILEGVRLAGSYKQYVLRDFKGLLRTRSLLARGHALLGPQTPEIVARLFGGRADPTASRRATRRRKPPPQRPAGVPDPAFWLVMEYWRLGDWRRPSE